MTGFTAPAAPLTAKTTFIVADGQCGAAAPNGCNGVQTNVGGGDRLTFTGGAGTLADGPDAVRGSDGWPGVREPRVPLTRAPSQTRAVSSVGARIHLVSLATAQPVVRAGPSRRQRPRTRSQSNRGGRRFQLRGHDLRRGEVLGRQRDRCARERIADAGSKEHEQHAGGRHRSHHWRQGDRPRPGVPLKLGARLRTYEQGRSKCWGAGGATGDGSEVCCVRETSVQRRRPRDRREGDRCGWTFTLPRAGGAAAPNGSNGVQTYVGGGDRLTFTGGAGRPPTARTPSGDRTGARGGETRACGIRGRSTSPPLSHQAQRPSRRRLSEGSKAAVTTASTTRRRYSPSALLPRGQTPATSPQALGSVIRGRAASASAGSPAARVSRRRTSTGMFSTRPRSPVESPSTGRRSTER